MITLITAVPGSGKTLFSISLIDEALKQNRPVFTNINGLVKDKFPNSALLQDAPDDWRDCPNGSLVIYDEAQQAHLYPSNAQRGKVEDERLTALETHRHGGYDLVFITQAPTFVHHHIRKLVGRHIHLYRARGVSGAVRYEWSHTCESPNDRREQERAETTVWKFPKHYFPYYTSAVMHTHKFKIPIKLALFLALLLLLVAYIVFTLVSNGGLQIFNDEKNGKGEKTPSAPAVSINSNSLTTLPPSTEWKLQGYTTLGSLTSVGRPLAVIRSVYGTRYIDFTQCDYDEYKLTVFCEIDGNTVSFYTGDSSKTPVSASPFN
ncbi:MAG: zonular occludens toxin [Inoviridae sp.]|nr:MAG: zonular occludens toxin [Inoviridae sp.]